MRHTRSYRRRLGAAFGASAVLHAALLVFAGRVYTPEPVRHAAYAPPLIVELPQPPEEELPERRLVETHTPTDEPVEDTPFISDADSKAADLHPDVGDDATPTPDVPSEGAIAARPAPTVPLPSPPPTPAPPPQPDPPLEEPVREQLAQARPVAPAPPPPAPEPPSPDEHDDPPQPMFGPVGGGVQVRGIGSFEARRDELAPYLLEVRRRVERRWRAALELRYTGSTPTSAVLACAIRPDGSLAYVTIIEPGSSVSFAGLCRGALERAAPFEPFPFEAPDIYRNRNLEIVWTFSFM